MFYGEFFCSFGSDPRDFSLPAMPHNTRQLQAINSTVCGDYVLLYAKLRCRNRSMREIVSCFTPIPAVNDAMIQRAEVQGWLRQP
jgi:hypothetical protein